MKRIDDEDIRRWQASAETLTEVAHGFSATSVSQAALEHTAGMPHHLAFVAAKLARDHEGELPADALDSIPFYSLCKGLLLPLSSMAPEKARWLFGLEIEPPPDARAKEELLLTFFEKPVGLSLVQKLACVLGDAFRGKRSTFRRDSLLRLLMGVQLVSRRALLDRLAAVGDPAVLFAECRPRLKEEPPLTSAEVLETLRYVREDRREARFEILRSLLERCGKLEAFFLAKLLLRRAGFGFDYQGPLLARAMAEPFGVSPDEVLHAMALTDPFHVASVLEEEGRAGLHSIQLKPLVPLRPALAGGFADELTRFPVWVERKYDGIRMLLHKSTDRTGAILCGAYTRRGNDWLELVAGLDATIRALPASSCIVDGELYGTVLDSYGGARQAAVYEVYSALQGERAQPITLRYAAFDVLYLNGADLTSLPLSERRRHLEALVGPLTRMPTPVPVSMADGQLASSREDLNRLYQHFRRQGYEGVIAKDLSRPYLLNARDPTWAKKKPELTLDLVLLGAVFAVTSKENVGMFGSYVIGARRPEGGFEDVGDVAGLDRVRDAEIQHEIMREGLLTGRRIERPSASGARPGVELAPSIVVTVKFSGITVDRPTGKLALRDPKLVHIRSDKSALEADTTAAIEKLHLKQRMG